MSCCEMGTCPCNPASDADRLDALERRMDEIVQQLADALHEILNLQRGKPFGSRE